MLRGLDLEEGALSAVLTSQKTMQMKNELPNVETRGEDFMSMDVTPDVPGFLDVIVPGSPVHRERVHEAMDDVSSE